MANALIRMFVDFAEHGDGVRMMRILVFGAGAIGGLVGARMLSAGLEVAFHDLAPVLEALRRDGLSLTEPDGTVLRLAPACIATGLDGYGPGDVVLLAVKAQQIGGALDDLARALRGGATLVTLQNGLPWWHFQCARGPHTGRPLRSLDPTGAIGAAVDPQRILGCVAYPAAEVLAPGQVKRIEGDRFPVGEPAGGASARAAAVADAFVRAGFKSPVLDDVRAEIWLKAWGNLAFNPVSALTGMTMAQICGFAPTRELVTRMMLEAQEIAGRLGISFRVPLQRRLEGAGKVGAHKTSMLQDREAGRALEIDAILGAVIELGRLTGAATGCLEAVYALTRAIDPGAGRAGT